MAVTLPFVVAYVMAVAVAAVDASVSVAGLVAVNFCYSKKFRVLILITIILLTKVIDLWDLILILLI